MVMYTIWKSFNHIPIGTQRWTTHPQYDRLRDSASTIRSTRLRASPDENRISYSAPSGQFKQVSNGSIDIL